MFDAVLLDFYGTVVHEDNLVIAEICGRISEAASSGVAPRVIDGYWLRVFSDAFKASHGDGFETQRVLEHRSLLQTIDHFGAHCDAVELSELMFEHWRSTPVFDDALAFL